MSGYSLKRAISFTITVSGGSGSTLIYGDEEIHRYAIKGAGSGYAIEFLDSDGFGLSNAEGLATNQNIEDSFRIGANGGATTITISGPNGTYTGRLWPRSF